MHCGRFITPPISRRDMLARCANGFGAVALAALLGEESSAGPIALASKPGVDPMAPRPTHFPAKAKNVIFLFMDGGPSQVDTFDPKPRLDREHGQPIKAKVQPTQFNDVGKVLKSPWAFKNRGESGIPVSDLFPHVGAHVDELAIVRSMVSNFSEHTAANYFMHTGNGLQGKPSHGAWVTYGLGSECRDLPGFVVLNGGLIPPGGVDCFGSGFLPASYQGSIFKAEGAPVANIRPTEGLARRPVTQARLMRRLDERRARAGRPPRPARGLDRQLRAGVQDADLRPRPDGPGGRVGRRPRSSMASTTSIARRGSSPASAWSPAGWSSAASGSSSSSAPTSATTAGTSTAT